MKLLGETQRFIILKDPTGRKLSVTERKERLRKAGSILPELHYYCAFYHRYMTIMVNSIKYHCQTTYLHEGIKILPQAVYTVIYRVSTSAKFVHSFAVSSITPEYVQRSQLYLQQYYC
jgi:hypothetical protein